MSGEEAIKEFEAAKADFEKAFWHKGAYRNAWVKKALRRLQIARLNIIDCPEE